MSGSGAPSREEWLGGDGVGAAEAQDDFGLGQGGPDPRVCCHGPPGVASKPQLIRRQLFFLSFFLGTTVKPGDARGDSRFPLPIRRLPRLCRPYWRRRRRGFD